MRQGRSVRVAKCGHGCIGDFGLPRRGLREEIGLVRERLRHGGLGLRRFTTCGMVPSERTLPNHASS
jgi:hypothetical protein